MASPSLLSWSQRDWLGSPTPIRQPLTLTVLSRSAILERGEHVPAEDPFATRSIGGEGAMRMKTSRVFMLLVTIVCAVRGFAQESPSRAHGFTPDKFYQFGEVDSINVFNGGLIIPIALGQRYKVSDGLSYGLQLTYNSNVWDYTQRCYFQYPLGGGTETICKNEAYPSRLSNAGIGFLVTMGELLPPLSEWNQSNQNGWSYVSPDGARHGFGTDFTRLRDVGPNVKEID